MQFNVMGLCCLVLNSNAKSSKKNQPFLDNIFNVTVCWDESFLLATVLHFFFFLPLTYQKLLISDL